jgi:catechol 2,3-dioxygenase-like lactoylglutathione lyase family enzyme
MQSLIPNTRLSHGTIECENCLTSRRFYQDILGLGSVRPLAEAQYLWSGGPWSLVCVAIGDKPKAQGVENRFCLRVDSAAEVDAARATALRARDEHQIADINELSVDGDIHSFTIRDRDGNWWEISNTSEAYYDDVFLRGDVPV